MASNVLPKTFRNNLNCDRIFRAKRQLFLIPLNRTAALPAALSNLTRPTFFRSTAAAAGTVSYISYSFLRTVWQILLAQVRRSLINYDKIPYFAT